MSSADFAPIPGRPTTSKYEPVLTLGRGGMAEVELSLLHGVGFTKLVVRKTLHAQLKGDPDYIALLLQEGQLGARLNHPNVVQTLDVGVEDGAPFVTMEVLDGVSYLELARLRGREAIPLTAHLRILCDVLAGLHHAHELADFDGRPLSVVHCDVSPQNVVVTCSGVSKVVDFGVARSALDPVTSGAPVVRGKFFYMSPEQILAQPIDRRADIFCVGIMLWEAITGERRWDQSTKPQGLQLVQDDSPDVRRYRPDAPEELALVCERALARDRSQRYGTAADMAADLEYVLARLGGGGLRLDLGEVVERRFAKRRAALEKKVRAVMARRAENAANATNPGAPNHRASSATTTDFAASMPVSATPSVAPAAAPVAPRRRGASYALLGVAIGLALVAGLARTEAPEAPAGAAQVSEPPPPVVAPPNATAPLLEGEQIDVAPTSPLAPATLSPPAPAPATRASAPRPSPVAPPRPTKRTHSAAAATSRAPAIAEPPVDLENPYR